MEILQMGFSNKKLAQFKKIVTQQKGFVLLLLIPLFSLMLTGLLGVSVMSLGIKNISLTQKACILENLSTQKQLKILLKEILSLNKKVYFLHKKKQFLEASLQTAMASGLIKTIPLLKKQILMVKAKQKILSLKQKTSLRKSQFVKKKSLKKLTRALNKKNIHSVRENTSFKKALALSKTKLSKEATLYKPSAYFSERQKTIFSWKMQALYPLFKTQFSKYQCVATLERDKMQWKERLFH